MISRGPWISRQEVWLPRSQLESDAKNSRQEELESDAKNSRQEVWLFPVHEATLCTRKSYGAPREVSVARRKRRLCRRVNSLSREFSLA